MTQWRVLPVTGRLFESARWLERERCFQWVDILSSRISRWFPATETIDSIELDFAVLPLATPSRAPGVQVLASHDTLYRYRWGDQPEPFATLPVGAEARLNDGVVDSSGRTWVGSMGLTPNREDPLGKLWRIDIDGAFTEMLCGLGISNGIAWTTGATGFLVDSLVGALYCVADRGDSLSREPALQFPSPIEPDGIVLADGIVWLALWGGAALGRFDPSSRDYAQVSVPADRPSSLAMSAEHVLVTTAGRGTGSDLDCSGQVLVRSLNSLEADV